MIIEVLQIAYDNVKTKTTINRKCVNQNQMDNNNYNEIVYCTGLLSILITSKSNPNPINRKETGGQNKITKLSF